jgi:aminoglycoside phosphotransferase family enzyme/predicted kinase
VKCLAEDLSADLIPPGGELRETHISWVFLDDKRALKVKKAVSLGFLDFSTPRLRQAACEAEVTLNRRLAPDVYRGVVPITRSASGRLRPGGDGPPVDWAVDMVRLPDASRGDVLLAEGELDRDALAIVARRLAAFHAECRCDEETSSFGEPAVIERNVRENFEQSEAALHRHLGRDEREALIREQTAFLGEHYALFRRRITGRRVRDGHGDLRLEHLYLTGDRSGAAADPLHDAAELRILDCIEFNDRFRYADVCADLAFLSMDLAVRGHVGLAEELVALYASASGDFELYRLIDFYESYRAFVRAKIAGFLEDSPYLSSALREEAAADARRHFLLALAAERRPALPPMIIAVGGMLAAGKSTLTEALAAELSCAFVSTDLTRKQLLGVAPTASVYESFGEGAYSPVAIENVYAEVEARAAHAFAGGRTVVVDGTFRSRASRDRLRAWAEAQGAPWVFVECRVPLDVSRARLEGRERNRSVSDARPELLDAFAAGYEPMSELPEDSLVIVDGTSPIEAAVAAVLRRVPSWPHDVT